MSYICHYFLQQSHAFLDAQIARIQEDAAMTTPNKYSAVGSKGVLASLTQDESPPKKAFPSFSSDESSSKTKQVTFAVEEPEGEPCDAPPAPPCPAAPPPPAAVRVAHSPGRRPASHSTPVAQAPGHRVQQRPSWPRSTPQRGATIPPSLFRAGASSSHLRAQPSRGAPPHRAPAGPFRPPHRPQGTMAPSLPRSRGSHHLPVSHSRAPPQSRRAFSSPPPAMRGGGGMYARSGPHPPRGGGRLAFPAPLARGGAPRAFAAAGRGVPRPAVQSHVWRGRR